MTDPADQTLVGMLARRARRLPGQPAFTFAGEPCTFGQLWDESNRFASYLTARGLKRGDRVLLALPNGREFFAVFFGVQRAGGVAVPLFPGSGAERVAGIAELCGARTVVVPSAADDPNWPVPPEGKRRGITVARVADSTRSPTAGGFPALRPHDVAFLQYTSGSTGNPKGVELSHANLLANLRHLIAGLRITPRDVFVSWLPVHHDMGLILMTLVPFLLAAKLVLLPTSLANARSWLAAIAEHRGTFTAAPDFAYRVLLRYVDDPGRYDLSSLRVALNAAEPVRARTIASFEAAFALDRVMIAGYGLAEATVGVSSWPPGRPAKVDERGFVSIGKPFPGVEMAVLTPDGLAAAGTEGELLVRSAATTRGYFRNPRATAGLYWNDGYLRTGDLGYRDADGDFFIVGRRKNIILHGGRNLAPQEIEEIVDALPAVRLSAAVGLDRGRPEGEQLYVFAELRPRTGTPGGRRKRITAEDFPEIARTVVERVHGRLGVRPARVYLLRPHAIPQTANGKLRHAELGARYLDGRLRRRGRVLFPDY